MTDAERGEIFRAFVNRGERHDGESHMTRLLDRCQAAERERDEARAELSEEAAAVADRDEEIKRLRGLVGEAHAYLVARNLGSAAEELRVKLRDVLLAAQFAG